MDRRSSSRGMGWVVAAATIVLGLLVLWRLWFRGLMCFDAEPGACEPPDDAFAGIDALLAVVGAAWVVSAVIWVQQRLGARRSRRDRRDRPGP